MKLRWLSGLTGLIGLTGCAPEGEDICAAAGRRYGQQVCLQDVESAEGWESLTVEARAVDQIRTGKYLVPATPEAPLPVVFVDAGTFPLHHLFFTQAFPEFYRNLTFDAYVTMVTSQEDREYFSGALTEYRQSGGGSFFGVIVWDDPARPDTAISCEQARIVLEALQPHFAIGALRFVASSVAQQEAVGGWTCGVPTGRPADVAYEVYTPGEAYGTVRMFDAIDLPAASAGGGFGWQDILVLDEAPFDLDRVVSGIVTGTRQGVLSHLNVRSAARGTVNAYLAEPHAALSAWADQPVHLVCDLDRYSVSAADPEDAQDFWDRLRPDPLDIPAPDRAQRALYGLLDLPVSTAADRDASVRAYGSKARNLATLYQTIPARYQLEGFVTPIGWYFDHLRQTTWIDPADGAARTLAASLAAWHADPAFLADGTLRRARLSALQAAILAAPVAPEVVAALQARVTEVFGADAPVRLRSSSNAEDAIGFSGAGLYTSVTACAACAGELPLDDGLRAVWASLWNPGAWEERDWYGIDHLQAGMAVLVNAQSEDERANIVAFSHSPLSDDSRMLVEAQAGDLDVVSADPGVWPERVFLTLQDGAVRLIERESHASDTDVWILTDIALQDLGALLSDIEGWYPLDASVPEGRTLIWDTEWKVLSDGRLIIKQIRPWLR